MKTIQERVLERIEETAQKSGLEATVSYQFNNEGRVLFTAPGSFEPLVNLHFSFQGDYATFAWRRDGKQAGYSDQSKDTRIAHVTYAKAKEVEAFMEKLRLDLPVLEPSVSDDHASI